MSAQRAPGPVRKDVTLDEAQTIVLAAREAELKAKADQLRRDYVGKFFKYRNSYGTGKRWWLYMVVTGVETWGVCKGWSFQRASRDAITIRFNDTSYVQNGGWQEITASEFYRAANQIVFAVRMKLMKPARRPKSSTRSAGKAS